MSILRVFRIRSIKRIFIAMVSMVLSSSSLDASEMAVASPRSSLSSKGARFSISVQHARSRSRALSQVSVQGTLRSAQKVYCTFALRDAQSVQRSKIYSIAEGTRLILDRLFFSSSKFNQGEGTVNQPYVYTCVSSDDLEYALMLLVAECSDSAQSTPLSLEDVQRITGISQKKEAQKVCEYLWFCDIVLSEKLEKDDEEQIQLQLWDDLMKRLHACLLKLYEAEVKKNSNDLKKYLQARDEEFLKRLEAHDEGLVKNQNSLQPLAEGLWTDLMKKVLPLNFEKNDGYDPKSAMSLKTPPIRASNSGEGSIASSTPEMTPKSGRPDRVMADDVRVTFSARGTARSSLPERVYGSIIEEDHLSQIDLGQYVPVGVLMQGNELDPVIQHEWRLTRFCRRYRKTAAALGVLIVGGLIIGSWKLYQTFA